MRVLVVEDDSFYAQRISELIGDHGSDARVVQNAQEALSVDLTTIDAAVIDLMLPNDEQQSGITAEESRGGHLAGLAVARRFSRSNPSIKIVLTSSFSSNAEAEAWGEQKSIPFVSKREGYESLLRILRQQGILPGESAPLAFIVHGHDSAAVGELKNYLQNILKWREPIVLREQPNLGRTIIEKFEDYAHKVDCAFVLLTPDDKIIDSGSSDDKRRSRQNVIFELGFFYSALGRRSGRVFLLHDGPVELPSDISGIVWIDISRGVPAAGEEIRREVAHIS
jgi:CheY-like chemotaxis protein